MVDIGVPQEPGLGPFHFVMPVTFFHFSLLNGFAFLFPYNLKFKCVQSYHSSTLNKKIEIPYDPVRG